jgi:hypothetical protein
MAQERPTTPEKQLLNLIEDPKEKDLSQKKIKRKTFNLVSFAALRARISFFQEDVFSGAFLKKAFLDIKGLNRVLRICILLLFLYVVGNFSMSVARLAEPPKFVVKNSRPPVEVLSQETTDKKLAFYLEGPRSRNIFKFGDSARQEEKPPVVKEEEQAEVAPPVDVPLSNAETLARQLGLVGIGWSDDPDVMVENIETKKMYFLKRGQKIDNLIKIEAIFQDKVILTYDNGKEMELR